MSTFLAKIRRRNVFRTAVAYAIVAWLIMQVTETFFPALHLPDWTVTLVAALLIIGFPLAIFFAWIFELTPEGIKVASSAGPETYHTRTTGQRLNYFIIGVLVLAVIFLVLDNYVLNDAVESNSVSTTESAVANANTEITPAVMEQRADTAPANSIAVLPFADMSAAHDQEYFADGIAEEILNSLARIRELEVRGRTSSFYFKGRNEDLHAISEMLNVEHILEGSVRKDGQQVRITVQLINTRKDAHLWSQTYDRTLNDIFTVQADIARSVADALQITLGVGELSRTPGMTRNVEAYDAFLAGHALDNRGGRDNNIRAMELLERAVALDPDYALAWTRLADCYGNATISVPERAGEFTEKRNAAYSRAVEIAPESVPSLAALSVLQRQDGNWAVAEQTVLRALALAPADFQANYTYAALLSSTGQPRKSLAYYELLARLEPLDSNLQIAMAVAEENSGNPDAATAAFERARVGQTAVPDSALLVLALEANDRARIEEYAHKVINTELLGNINRAETRDLNEVMLALLDTPQQAETELRAFLVDPAYASPFLRSGVAVWAAYFGEPELALQAFANTNSLIDITITIWRPLMVEMRRLPGFKDLVRKLGLAQYWRETGNWGNFCRPAGADDFICD